MVLCWIRWNKCYTANRNHLLHLTLLYLPYWNRSGLTMPLCRHNDCGNLSGNKLTGNLSRNTQPQLPQLAEPLWTYPGLRSWISVRSLISTQKTPKAQAGNEHSPKILASEEKASTTTEMWQHQQSHTRWCEILLCLPRKLIWAKVACRIWWDNCRSALLLCYFITIINDMWICVKYKHIGEIQRHSCVLHTNT